MGTTRRSALRAVVILAHQRFLLASLILHIDMKHAPLAPSIDDLFQGGWQKEHLELQVEGRSAVQPERGTVL